MEDKCTISEHISSIWKSLIVSGLIVTVLFILLIILSDNALYEGIFRVIAFCGFTSTVLAYLQIRVKAQEIELQLDEEHLVITYFSESKKSQEELFELQTIANINRIENPPVWKVLPRSDCAKFVISFTDSKNTLSLFRIEGRDLCVSHPDAEIAEKFLNQFLSKQKID